MRRVCHTVLTQQLCRWSMNRRNIGSPASSAGKCPAPTLTTQCSLRGREQRGELLWSRRVLLAELGAAVQPLNGAGMTRHRLDIKICENLLQYLRMHALSYVPCVSCAHAHCLGTAVLALGACGDVAPLACMHIYMVAFCRAAAYRTSRARGS